MGITSKRALSVRVPAYMQKAQSVKERLAEAEAIAKLGGGPKRIAKQHAKGKLTARERLELLLDEGSFRDSMCLVASRQHLRALAERYAAGGRRSDWPWSCRRSTSLRLFAGAHREIQLPHAAFLLVSHVAQLFCSCVGLYSFWWIALRDACGEDLQDHGPGDCRLKVAAFEQHLSK
eukprot:5189863-Pleurochrysis_carterae.AAC.4